MKSSCFSHSTLYFKISTEFYTVSAYIFKVSVKIDTERNFAESA